MLTEADEDRNLRIGYALRWVMRFMGALRTPGANPWQAVFLRKGIENGD